MTQSWTHLHRCGMLAVLAIGLTVTPAAVAAEGMVPVDAKTYRAMKAHAASAAAQEADDSLDLPLASGPRATDVLASFVGLDRASATNNGVAFGSANISVARSDLFNVIEVANSAIRMFATSGGVIQTKDLNSFFGASLLNGRLFSPKAYFDRIGVRRRVYVAALQTRGGSTEAARLSTLWLAVSRSSTPPSLDPQFWCFYQFNAKRNAPTTLSSAAGTLGLGGGRDALLVTTDQFRFSNGAFTFAIIRAFRKDPLSNNNSGFCPSASTVAPFAVFQPSATVGDLAAHGLQPVQHHFAPASFTGTTNPAYLVNTRFGTSNTYRLWQVRNVASSSPSVRNVTVAGSFTYALPPDAPQGGTSIRLDTGDNRITQAASSIQLGGDISAVHSTLCTSGGVSNKSCVRVVRILPGQTSGGSLTAVIDQQRTFGGYNVFSFFQPTISVNIWGQRAVAFLSNNAQAGLFLSSYWTLSDRDVLFFPWALQLSRGNCALTTTAQIGYIGAHLDPSDVTTFWLAGQRARIGAPCQWESQLIQVNPGIEGILAP